MLKKELKIFAISLVVSINSSCQSSNFDWDPIPYSGDSVNKQMVRANGEIIKCDQSGFDFITGFDCGDIAALKTEIDRINNSKQKKKILKFIESKINRRCEN